VSTVTSKFDPWGPVSTALYETVDSDFVQDAIANTGVDVVWHPLTKDERYSHSTRIRAFRRDISAAYANLDDEEKGHFAQIVTKAMLGRHDGVAIRAKLVDRLSDIGWTISENGILRTEDALISEQFFPPGSEHDAYITIREIIAKASRDIIVVDAYVGSSLLLTVKALPRQALRVRFLTVERNLKPDFILEVAAFQQQVSHIELEVRASTDFHDRFIAIDSTEFYHVGASLKDAGKRAFMISRIHDPPNVERTRGFIENAWNMGKFLR
jgi:hypothetical protein